MSDISVVYVPTGKLRPFPGNPRKISGQEMAKLRRSIRDFGFVDPVIAQKGGEVIGGHQRIEAAKAEGVKAVPVVYLDIPNDKAQLLNVALNKISGEWDWPKLGDLFQELDTGELDLAMSGFDMAEIEGLMNGLDNARHEEDNDIPEPPAEPISKTGDLWLLGEHRLLCGDCTKKEDVERLMDGEKTELCFTSPPYSDMRNYGGCDLSISHLSQFIPTSKPHCNYYAVNLGIKRESGEIIRYWDEYIATAELAGLKLLSWNVWNRENAGFSMAQITAMFAIQHEFIFVFGNKPKKLNLTVPNKDAGEFCDHLSNRQKDGSTKKAKALIIRNSRQLGTVNTINNEQSRKWTGEHPALFPVSLPVEYIKAFGGDVYEPFSGSGTTIIAAEQLNRKCYAMEIEPRYVDVAVKRWENYTGKKAKLSN